MNKFLPLSEYEQTLSAGYKPLPFRFAQLEGDEYVATNLAGEFVLLSRSVLEDFARGQLPLNSPDYDSLKAKHFLLACLIHEAFGPGSYSLV